LKQEQQQQQHKKGRALLTTYKPPIDDSLGDISHFAPVRRPWPVDQVSGTFGHASPH
jgi:hypothetical protein